MTPHVLVLSNLYDFSADLVALQLSQAEVPYVRLNREHLGEHRLTLNPLIPELSIRGPAGTHHVGPGLRSIWFRQPVFLRNTPPIPLSPSDQLEYRNGWPSFGRSACLGTSGG